MADSACANCENNNCSAQNRRQNETNEEFMERQQLMRNMCKIKHKILVLSGKGGVGKSTVAVNLAMGLAMNGAKVGLIDADVHGPSVPKMLNLENAAIEGNGNVIYPVVYNDNFKIMSIGFFLESQDSAVIWRGPKKYSLIKQFMKDVEWGELDYLLFDLPPGTGDEPLSICQLIENADGAVIVSTPQGVAVSDVRKSVTFCRQLKLPVIGVIENMSGFKCPKCGEVVDIFGSGGAENMAENMNIEYLGKIPIEPEIVKNADSGIPIVFQNDNAPAAENFLKIIDKIDKKVNK